MDLETLSDDLLLDIMELVSQPEPRYLHKGHQRNELLSFVCCSRRLYRLGEPVLYRKLTQTTSKTLPRFIKTLLAHPNLADHVRIVSLTDRGPSEPDEPESPVGELKAISQGHIRDILIEQTIHVATNSVSSSAKRPYFNQEEVETIEAIIISLSSDRAPSLMKDIIRGTWEALAALALLLLPNVEDLQVEKVQAKRWQTLGHTRNLLSHPFPFAVKPTAKLRNLSISYEKRACKDGLTAVPFHLLALPSLHSFSGDMMRETLWKNPSDTKFPIKRLHLDRCNFSTTALVNLINACPDLEALKYEHDEEEQEYPFYPKQFDAALADLRSSLKELILYRTAREPTQMTTAAQFDIIKSARQLEKLTSLSITARLLLGPQRGESLQWFAAALQHPGESQSLDSCLPPNLEHLKLKNCGYDIFDQVTLLIEVKEMVVPSLKSVIIEFVHVQGNSSSVEQAWSNLLRFGTSSDAVKKLDEVCQENGVLLDVWYN
jgi:hypothetical protein